MSGGESQVVEVLKRAFGLHQAGRLQEAETAYQQVLADAPQSADAHHLMGVLAYQTKRYALAVESIERAVQLNPRMAAAFINLGNAYQDAGNSDKAIESYQKALALQPDSAVAHNNLGALLRDRGSVDEAEENFRRALAIQPAYLDACLNLVSVLKARGIHDEAVAWARRACESAPDEADVHVQLGRLYRSLDRHEEAVAAYRRAIELDPARKEWHNNLGNLLRKCQRHEEATDAYLRALKLDPQYAEAHCNLGTALQSLGELDRAVAGYRTALALRPNYANAHVCLGSVLEVQRRFEEAIGHLEKAIGLEPKHADTYVFLAMIHMREGRPEAACEVLTRCLQESPGHLRAAYYLAAFGGKQQFERAPDAYVAQEFDHMAADFDRKLRQTLQYRGPEQLHELVCGVMGEPSGLRVLDLGCGTGLCGERFRAMSKVLVGIDLSPGMLAKARERGVYDQLIEGELLTEIPDLKGPFDLVLAGDVLMYFGDLAPLMAAVAGCMAPDGWFVFTVERGENFGFFLHPKGRYAHHAAYVREVADEAGFVVARMDEAALRTEAGRPVMGYVCALSKKG